MPRVLTKEPVFDIGAVRYSLVGCMGDEEHGQDPNQEYGPWFVRREVCVSIEAPERWCRPERWAVWERQDDWEEPPDGTLDRDEALQISRRAAKAERKKARGKYVVLEEVL